MNQPMPAAFDLEAHSPWLNAAGVLGFAPGQAWHWPKQQGAFVTNPISLHARTPAEQRACLPFEGGALLHSGLPNPGLRAILKRCLPRWQRSEMPIWVHLLAEQPAEIERMVRILEELQLVSVIEIGLPPLASPEQALRLIQAASGELPVVACLSLTRAQESWLGELAQAGASGLTLAAPRGQLPKADGGWQSGRLLGAALFPLVLNAVRETRGLGLPVIAGCGVASPAHGEALLAAGAWAVEVDTALWL